MVNVCSRWLLSHVIAYEPAIVIAYGLGMVTGFLLFKYVVFKSAGSRRTRQESFWYVVVNILALAQVLAVSVFLADYFFPWSGMNYYPYDVAHLIGTGVPIISSYLVHKHLTFKK